LKAFEWGKYIIKIQKVKKALILLQLLFILFSACTLKNQGKVELIIDSKSDLGEGAIWNDKTNELYWVDITGKILNIYNPSTGNNKELFTGQMIGTVVPGESV